MSLKYCRSLIRLTLTRENGFLYDVMNRSFATVSCGTLRTTQVPFVGAGMNASIHSSYPSVHNGAWATGAAVTAWSTVKSAFASTANPCAAAGMATGVANTKRSPQRLGESLT